MLRSCVGLMSNATVIREAPAKKAGCLGPDEIGAEFEGLSAEDKLKLSAIEAGFRGGTGFGWNELVYEAVCRALTGDRNCPRDVPFMAFLVETMRSIAHHERAKRRRSVPLTLVPRQGGAADGPPDCASEQLTPEEHLLERESADVVQAIHGLFADDPEAQLVLMGWAEALRGKALREATGLDQAALGYAAKRIRSRMRKQYPNGWTP
jgi:DNA-directed RNA polymerase specialized sigma24 family protein